tara:strand:- start:663 stop:953 length:291 start_codon:yes stop_codon:yes gene_type:complete
MEKRKKRTSKYRNHILNIFSQKWWLLLLDNPEGLDLSSSMFLSKFIVDQKDFMIQEYRKYMAAFLIQNRWRNARVNPYCKIGWNKVNRDYDSIFLH